ncbi:MAG: alpha/beta fold hydrolase [Acidobacteriota bacterium]|nr:alpha/beta hydrolase [Blastocatellia bacterium]MDW8240057.1 alpha/beta fold hydrolase [Acidobacteriota bacterium]
MPKAQTNGIELYYEIHGHGEPLVLIAGFGVGLWVWYKQIPTLSQSFQVIVFDNRGAGQSDKPEERHTIRTMADDLAGLLVALGIQQANILGASLGGFIAQEFALAYPQMTRRLILCATGFGGPHYVLPSEDVLSAMSDMEGLGTEERARQNIRLFYSPTFIQEHPDEIEMLIRLYLENPMPEHARMNQLIAAMAFDTEARLSAITAPTLVLTADQDICVPPENSKNLAERIPNATLMTISGAGHGFFIEKADEFNRLVTEFIQQHG